MTLLSKLKPLCPLPLCFYKIFRFFEIPQHLPESYHAEIDELSSNLEKALETLVDELRHPTLILATTGTTSSGKSTLVNFLCGADIVPTAVSEMSAGAVTIEYSEEKTLIIQETPGALWECGEWRDISDEEIYDLLDDAMTSYIEAREENDGLVCPQSLIRYPFRLVKDKNLLELPEGTKVNLLDLPGLSYVGDEGNLAIIKQCRQALCLVTYNSEETDPNKVKNLLLEVVEQVKDLGGSPARMLFILNKIDVFRKDQRWPKTEERFITKTTKSIKQELTEKLREYTSEIENLTVVKLSTWPALLALQILNSKDYIENILEELPIAPNKWSEHDKKRIEALLKPHEQAIDHFQFLIKDAIRRENLDNNPLKWTINQQELIAYELCQKSYAEEFEKYLKNHIEQHFPKLVIPQAIEKFNVSAGNSVIRWAVQTTTAIVNASEENYQKEVEKISHIRASLEHFLEISDSTLRSPFEKISNNWKDYRQKKTTNNPISMLTEAINELQFTEPYNQIEEKLVPLYDWRNTLGKTVDQILEAVANSLENGIVKLDHPNFRKSQILHIESLEGDLRRLIELGYSGYSAKHGENVIAKTNEEKTRLKNKNDALNRLSISLSLVIADILDKVSTQEIQRMYDSVNSLFVCYLDHLEKGANRIAPDIVIKFPESELHKVTNHLNFNFIKFNSDFDITQGQYIEKTRTWKYWLGIVPKKEQRSSDNATIPSIGQILTDWKKQLQAVEPDMLGQVIEWLMAQVDNLKKRVSKTQNKILNTYQERLEKARKEITYDYEEQQQVWQPMQKKAKELEYSFLELGILESNNREDSSEN